MLLGMILTMKLFIDELGCYLKVYYAVKLPLWDNHVWLMYIFCKQDYFVQGIILAVLYYTVGYFWGFKICGLES